MSTFWFVVARTVGVIGSLFILFCLIVWPIIDYTEKTRRR